MFGSLDILLWWALRLHSRKCVYVYIYMLVLILNNFVFNGVNYLQKMGVAMGTRSAPNVSNVFMGYFEKRFVYNSKWFKRFIKSWWSYIDDIFML